MWVSLCNVRWQNNSEKTSVSSHSLLTVTGNWPCDLLIRASKAVIMAWEKFSASSRLAKLRPYTWRLSRHWWKVGVAWLYFNPFRMAQFITTWNRHKDVTLLVPVAWFNGTPRKEAGWPGNWEHFVFSIGRLLVQCPGNRSAFFASNLSVSPCLGSSLFTNEEMEKQVGLCQNGSAHKFFQKLSNTDLKNKNDFDEYIMRTCTVMFSHSQFQ